MMIIIVTANSINSSNVFESNVSLSTKALKRKKYNENLPLRDKV